MYETSSVQRPRRPAGVFGRRKLIYALVASLSMIALAALVPSAGQASTNRPAARSAQPPLAPCPDETPVITNIRVPSSIPRGRSAPLVFDNAVAGRESQVVGVDLEVGGVRVKTFDPMDEHVRYLLQMPTTARAPLSVTLSWREHVTPIDDSMELDPEYDCGEERAFMVDVAPDKTVAGMTFSTHTGYTQYSEVATFSVRGSCAGLPATPVTFSLKTGGQTHRMHSSDICAGTRQAIRANLWTLNKVARGYVFEPAPFGAEPKEQRFVYSVVVAGRAIAKGTLVVGRRYFPPLLAWQGTDAFQNICVVQHRPIYSKHLRKYCVSEAEFYVVVVKRLP